ncbi:MAG: hypothetical protein K8R76_00635 [Candidatus Aegiribacteria sp.]|nr:hypothetical protein [Candidatus Aegiribacteria sp.]
MSLKDFRLQLLDRMLDIVWSQWITLGISGNLPPTDRWILDPEALVLFTCNIGRYEPRVFDSMLEWLKVNQRFLNVQRLKTINKRENFAGKNLLAAIAHLLMKPASRSKWERLSEQMLTKPLKEQSLFRLKDGSPHPQLENADTSFSKAGYIRQEFRYRKAIAHFKPDLRANLTMKLRTLFGVNSRCEVIAYLLTHDDANPTEISAVTGYSSKTIYNAISEMYMSGKLNRRVSGKESLYSLGDNSWLAFLCPDGRTARWMDWPKAFRSLEIIWTAIDNPRLINEDTELAASELKLAFNEARPRLQKAVPGYIKELPSSREGSELRLEEICDAVESLIEYLA